MSITTGTQPSIQLPLLCFWMIWKCDQRQRSLNCKILQFDRNCSFVLRNNWLKFLKVRNEDWHDDRRTNILLKNENQYPRRIHVRIEEKTTNQRDHSNHNCLYSQWVTSFLHSSVDTKGEDLWIKEDVTNKTEKKLDKYQKTFRKLMPNFSFCLNNFLFRDSLVDNIFGYFVVIVNPFRKSIKKFLNSRINCQIFSKLKIKFFEDHF